MEYCMKKQKLDSTIIKEGEAEILVDDVNVFYNPVQEFNRDLSVAVLTTYIKNRNEEAVKANAEEQKGIALLEALSATGLRSIRYAKEVQGIERIVANDISAKAVESIKKNVKHNGVENIVEASQEDATLLMYQSRRDKFNAIDLDPYGCPTIFLDGAVQCVSDGGLLMITATDMAVLAGRYGRYVTPILSVSADFYIRAFVKVFSSQIKCKENATKIGTIYQCTGCESINTQPLCYKNLSGVYKLTSLPYVNRYCDICHHKQHEGGPIWLGPLHDQHFVSHLLCNLGEMKLGTLKRIEGVLNVIHEELDVPLYYTLDRLMSIIRCVTPPMLMFRSALLNAGYRVSYSHACKTSIKTNAPNNIIWDIVRTWEKANPIKRDKLSNDSPAIKILDAPTTTNVSFTVHPLANPVSRQNKLTRFQQNPATNWGPGTRSRTRIDLENSKKIKNQNKNSKTGKPQMIESTDKTKI
ncbi:unnamed protein product [Xylocopa violacea]|uniref:tRNA (guanine(26)-N(2))-dimethyltransferase n=1 Tax=Xylocopa violacea TaxID=135666 RepID=A0ABP1NGC6_XYLVO